MAILSTGRVAGAIFLSLSIGSANAFWRLECDGSVGLARMDPLMDYGRAAGHVHSIKGGSGKLIHLYMAFFSPNLLKREIHHREITSSRSEICKL